MSDEVPARSNNLAKLAALAVFVVLGVYGVLHAGDDSPADAGGLAKATAWGACKDAVKDRLANPATADFSLLSTTITDTGAGYDIAGSLTAENDFGVEQQIAFSCDVAGDGSVSASLARSN